MKYKIKHRLTNKEWGYVYTLQDAENAKLHLEDLGQNYGLLDIIEVDDSKGEQ